MSTQPPTILGSVADFLCRSASTEIPQEVLHETKRLLLHGLTATLGAQDHSAMSTIDRWTREFATERPGRALWVHTPSRAEDAVLVNATMWFLLLADESHAETAGHPTGPAASAAFAAGELSGASGADTLKAIAVGIETELGILSMIGRGTYARGLTNVGLGAIFGAAASAAAVHRLDARSASNALALAAITGAPGIYGQAGSVGSALNVGTSARAGYAATELAARGIAAPPTVLEGQSGLLRAYGDVMDTEPARRVADELGNRWRLFDLHYLPCRGDTFTPAAVEAALGLRKGAPTSKPRRAEFIRCEVAESVKHAVEERQRRVGSPASDLEAASDMAYCVASAWISGPRPIREWSASDVRDAATARLRDRIQFVARPATDSSEPLGARVEVHYEDGSCEAASVERFRGHAGNAFSDSELESRFAEAAAGRLAERRVRKIVQGVWSLERYDSISRFLDLLALDAPIE